MLPTREEALKLIRDGLLFNPGPWGKHCLTAAHCAEKIASACGDMDVEKAYILGLLHDIGRKFGVRHDFVFSYRVGGILKHNGKILLQRPKNDDYAIIGGHVAAMETSMETLKREFEEELHAKIEVDNLLAIGEIYFPWGKRPCHQICLYYNVHLMDDNIPLDGVFHGYDELDNERIDLDFCWVSLEDLKKGTKVYPLELIPYILESGKEIVHFVSKQI